jgi:hypothetical protein
MTTAPWDEGLLLLLERNGYAEGFDAHLVKPVQMDHLTRLLRELHARR